MKDRKRLVHLGEFNLDEVLPFISEEDIKKDYTVDGTSYQVRMNSDRYFVFKDNNICVACGLEGTKMVLDINPGDQSPHFNMYAEENGRLVLMTKDHILAKSQGGQDELPNYQTMCSCCNNLKGAYDLSLDDVRELRKLHNNEDKLPRKELRDLINETRDKMKQ
jgi:5-methylcytosine-specific restriction endonuclease McrA